MGKRYSYLLMLGHICTDINQGALPAILPFLIASRNMGYASAAGLVFAANLVSSVVQPLVGYMGDRSSWPWLMSLGIALAGSGIAIIGFCNSYAAICAAAVLSGLGIALFHPEGGKIANYAAGEKKGAGISIFAVGGNLGFAIGPIVASAALSAFGLKGTAVFLVPAFFMSAVILFFMPRLKKLTPAAALKSAAAEADARPDDWGAFARVSSVVFCRSIVHYGLMTFIPLYFVGRFLLPEATANTRLTIFSLAGAAATLIGGRVADRYGFRRTIRVCFAALFPLLLLLFYMNNSVLATLFIIPIGIAMNGAFSTMIAMGQSFLPNHIGFASGISLGLAISIGGLCAPIIGWVGDTYGIMAAMYTITGIAFLALLLAFMIPKERGQVAGKV